MLIKKLEKTINNICIYDIIKSFYQLQLHIALCWHLHSLNLSVKKFEIK